MKKSFLLFFALIVFSATSLLAQSPIGIWKTIDDETGKVKSKVEIYELNGKLYGKILQLYNNDEENPICDLCTDDRKNQPILGMIIIKGLVQDGKYYKAKKGILDPANGKLYDVKIWVEGNTLKVKGSIGPIGRTQTWIKVK